MAKICPYCEKVKPERAFRYIRYLGTYRRICRRCEGIQKGQRKAKKTRGKKQRIKEAAQYGLTPQVFKKLKEGAEEKALAEARANVEGKLSASERAAYARGCAKENRWGKLEDSVEILVGCALFLTIFFTLPSLLFFSSFFWQPLPLLGVTLPVIFIAKMRQRFYRERYAGGVVRRTEREKARQLDGLLQKCFEKALDARKSYEVFYQTTEWRILRESFLKTQPRVGGLYRCALCHELIKSDDVTVDHIKPRSKYLEFALDIQNLQVAHRACNSSKGDRFLEI